MDSLGVNRLLRAMYTDPNTHGLPLLNLELPELLSLSLSLSKSTMAKVHWQKGFHWQERSWKDYKMEQEWGKKDFHQFYMA